MSSVADRMIDKVVRSPYGALAPRAREAIDLLAARIDAYRPTPMRTFEVDVAGRRRRIRLKLEGESPWRSIKGRTAIGLVASVAHRITDRSAIVESTSGNLGAALAALAGDLGMSFTAVVDDLLPAAMSERMRTAGARLVIADATQTGGDRLAARIRTVSEICAADPDALWTNQYANLANPLIHELWTGPELIAQAVGTQAVFAGVSTGGTLHGIAGAVRAAGKPIKVVGVDVEGSRAFGGCDHLRVLTGIGASRPSQHIGSETCDDVEVVPSWAGVLCCHGWERSTGLALGGSSGAVLAAALRHLSVHPELTDVVCVCADLGENYIDTIYDDTWVHNARERLRTAGLLGQVVDSDLYSIDLWEHAS